MPFRFQYILMLAEALGLLNLTICIYRSVIDFSFGAEKKLHLQVEKIVFFFFFFP